MTIYVENKTSSDMKFPYKGEIYLFLANGISSVDETVLPYSILSRAYGFENLYQIEQPTQNQISASQSALQTYFTGLSIEAEALIKSNYGVSGDSNAQRKKYLIEQLLLSEASSGTGAIIKPILASGTGTGNATITVPSSNSLNIQNTGPDSLSFTIGSITITMAPLSSFEDSFNAFTVINITTTSSYNWYTE